MNKSYESEERIAGFLRSVFRYKRMLDNKAPDELLSMEKIILQDKMSALSAEEIFVAVVSWKDYYETSIVEEEIEDEQTIRQVNSFIQTLN